ncbi:unnamed protein product [Symbiodinium sp. CCMP2456]|nr:unnamed protein product [Symbiodinium sp. CCMP2456]
MPASLSPVSVLPVESLEGAEESGSQATPESDKMHESLFIDSCSEHLAFGRKETSRRLAFLDVGCINPTEDSLTVEGLISMGAFLKNSESLLVLWDETYVARLWCMFEMAAFLRSKGLGVGTGKCLVVWPVFVGPALLVGQLAASIFIIATLRFSHAGLYAHLIFQATVAFPSFLLLAYVVLAHYHNVEVVQEQVGSFSIKDSACYCCSHSHVKDGVEMICDRVVIVRCIEAWFGSVEHFETAVRGEVRRAMVHQLANNVFSYWRIVQALAPTMWLHMDLLAPDFTVHLSLVACTYVFTLLPIVALICLRICYGLRKFFRGSQCCKILLSTVPLAVGILTYAIFFYVDKILLPHLLDVQYFHSDPVPRTAIVLGISSVATVLLWLCLPSM